MSSSRTSAIERLPSDLAVLLDKLAAELKKSYGEHYRGLVLYGSYARGEADEGSDVVIVVAEALPQLRSPLQIVLYRHNPPNS